MSSTAETATDSAREALVARLTEVLGDAVVGSYIKPGLDVWVRVRTDAWRAAGHAVRSHLGMDYFDFLSMIDWLPSPFGKGEDDPTEPPPERSTEVVQGYTGGDTRFQMLARVMSSSSHLGITLKADVPDEPFAVDSWIPVYAGANWHEREAHEMFGVSFVDHPDLRNLYLPTGFEGHPLRKDFPLLARMVKPWPGIVDVEPIPAEFDQDAAEEPAEEAST